jgi:hypothetical protein
MVPIVGFWQEAPQIARSGVASNRSSLHSLLKVVVLGAWPMTCLQDRLVDRGGSLELELTQRDRRLLNLNSKASMFSEDILCFRQSCQAQAGCAFLRRWQGESSALYLELAASCPPPAKEESKNVPLTQFQSFQVSKNPIEIGGFE